MALFNLFSNKQNHSDSTIDADELANLQTNNESDSVEDVKPDLSIHPDWQLKSELHYVYKFQNNQLPSLKPNQVSISGIQLEKKESTIDVHAFVRHSLNQPLTLGETTLLLMDENGKLIGRKGFNFEVLGTLPPHASRPWIFTFHKNELVSENIPSDGWKLAFELKRKHHLDLAESWQQSLAKEQIEKLDQLVNRLAPPKSGELNLMGLQTTFNDNGDLNVSILIRNGSQKNISIESLPLVIEDTEGQSVASGTFKLENFEVKANTSKPWTFVFPSHLVKIENPDLSKWRAVIPKND